MLLSLPQLSCWYSPNTLLNRIFHHIQTLLNIICSYLSQPNIVIVLCGNSRRCSGFDNLISSFFQICCSTSPQGLCDPYDERWMSTDIINTKTNLVTLTTAYCRSMSVLGHRYAWRTNPCPYKECALYSTKTGLPAPVYVSLGQLKGDGQWHEIRY